MAGIRTWIPESDILKPGETSSVQEIRTWFERLPRMRALIRQKQEHIESLRSAATTTTSSHSGAPGHSGTSRCLILFFVEGKRHAEIAPEVGYSNPSQVSRAISEGLAQLAELTNELNLS